MPRFLLGLLLAAAAFGVVGVSTSNSGLAVAVACVVAIGVWFKCFEILFDISWSGIAWVARALFD